MSVKLENIPVRHRVALEVLKSLIASGIDLSTSALIRESFEITDEFIKGLNTRTPAEIEVERLERRLNKVTEERNKAQATLRKIPVKPEDETFRIFIDGKQMPLTVSEHLGGARIAAAKMARSTDWRRIEIHKRNEQGFYGLYTWKTKQGGWRK